MKLVVEDLGPTVARNVRIKFDPPLKSASFADRVEGLKIFTDGIPPAPSRTPYPMAVRHRPGHLQQRRSEAIPRDH
jgi:hypothetical protein